MSGGELKGAAFYLSGDAVGRWDGAARDVGASRSALAEAVAAVLFGGGPGLDEETRARVLAVLGDAAREISADRRDRSGDRL